MMKMYNVELSMFRGFTKEHAGNGGKLSLNITCSTMKQLFDYILENHPYRYVVSIVLTNYSTENIITLGDGNQINAEFGELGKSLVELRDTIVKSEAQESEKMVLIADIDTIQSQLAKPKPSQSIIKTAWGAVKATASLGGCAELVQKITESIAGLL